MRGNFWTEDELRILSENRDKTIIDIMVLLPNRNYSSIRTKRNHLLKSGYKLFTEEEKDLVAKSYRERCAVGDIVKVINELESNQKQGIVRTLGDIISEVHALRSVGSITGNKRYKRDNNARMEYNKKYYGRTTNAPNRDKMYTAEEEDIILNSEYTDTELSKIIGRSVRAIQIKRCKLKSGK